MVSAPDSRASSPGLGPGCEHCAVLLGKTLYSHGAGRFNAGSNPAMDGHPIQGGGGGG